MLGDESIRQFVVEELTRERAQDAITDEFPLLGGRALDSLGLLQLVSFLESEFDIEIRDEELVPANFGTIGDISRLVRSKRDASPSTGSER